MRLRNIGHALLIPPANRPVTQSSSASSSRSTPDLPIPPPRARLPSRAPARQGSSDSAPRYPTLMRQGDQGVSPSMQAVPRKDSKDSLVRAVKQARPSPQSTTKLDASNIIKSDPKPRAIAPKQDAPENAFVADWLSRPNPSMSLPQSPRSGSVYLAVQTQPKDRPTIPKGGLAPAPPPKVKGSPAPGAGGSQQSSGMPPVGSNKWADRLRNR